MSDAIPRRAFTTLSAGLLLGASSDQGLAQDPPPKPPTPTPAAGPEEAPFERDYPAPKFKPSWKKKQINRLLVADFVVYAHSDLEMVKKLTAKEPMLVNAMMDWGGGDWESGLGGASHMGNKAIVQFLLENGARIDLFCAAMLGKLEVVQSLISMQPKLIDSRGPHGFNLHFHAQVGGKDAEPVLDYLQSVKKIELKPNPFLRKPGEAKPGETKSGETKAVEGSKKKTD